MKRWRAFFKVVPLIVAFLAVLSLVFHRYIERYPVPSKTKEVLVKTVIDGDTIVVQGGKKVRYIGVDTPEFGEPLYEEARSRNISLVGGRYVELRICEEEPRDRYGRVLAWVYVDGQLVDEILLEEGLARVFTKSPCVGEKLDELKAYERKARLEGIGIWKVDEKRVEKNLPTITPDKARLFVGREVRVEGKVVDVYKGRGAVFINFGRDYRRDFSAVVLGKYLYRFDARGIDPDIYKGRRIAVEGKVELYRGRVEIVVRDPQQIEILD